MHRSDWADPPIGLTEGAGWKWDLEGRSHMSARMGVCCHGEQMGLGNRQICSVQEPAGTQTGTSAPTAGASAEQRSVPV